MKQKERAIFFLERRIRELGAVMAKPDHQAMANAGMNYAQRADAVKKAEEIVDKNKNEFEALTYVLDVVKQHG